MLYDLYKDIRDEIAAHYGLHGDGATARRVLQRAATLQFHARSLQRDGQPVGIHRSQRSLARHHRPELPRSARRIQPDLLLHGTVRVWGDQHLAV